MSAFRLELETAEFNEEEYLPAIPMLRRPSVPEGSHRDALTISGSDLGERRPMSRAKRSAPLKLGLPPSRRDKILANIDLQAKL